MPRSRDMLQRFRPAGTPGAAANVGVPADRVAEVTAELEPVLAMLAETQEEAARIRSDATRQGEQRQRLARERASALVSAARSDAAAERADAALQVSHRLEREGARLLASAERDAVAVRRQAAARMPAYVDRLISAIAAALSDVEDEP